MKLDRGSFPGLAPIPNFHPSCDLGRDVIIGGFPPGYFVLKLVDRQFGDTESLKSERGEEL